MSEDDIEDILGEFNLDIPRKNYHGVKTDMHLRLTPKLLGRLDNFCTATGMNWPQAVRYLLDKHLP